MAKPWSIEVTREDLDLGEMQNSNRCAVQRAVARCVPDAKRVEVDVQTIRFSRDSERHVYLTPWQVAEYVIAFDAGDGEKLEPFSFMLRESAEVGSKVRRQAFTDAGRKVDAARSQMRKARAKKEEALQLLARPETERTATETAKAQEALEAIDEKIETLEQQYAEVRAEVKESGESQLERVDSDLPKPPRRYKTRRREFGRRVLRVNQAEDRWHTSND